MDREYKGYNVVISSQFNLRRIATIGRGTLPAALKGSFNSFGEATKAIDLYLNSKEVKTRGKTK